MTVEQGVHSQSANTCRSAFAQSHRDPNHYIPCDCGSAASAFPWGSPPPLLDDHLPLGKIEVTQLLITLALLMEMTQAVSGVRSTVSLRLHLDTCAYFPLYSHYNYSFIDVDLCHSLSS